MSYSAGTLELSIFNTSSGEIANIDKMAKSLSALSRALKSVSEASKLSNEDFSRVGNNLSKLFSKISKLTSSLDVKGLSSLANASKSLVAISKLGNLADIDFEKVGQGFSRLTQEITPFINKVKEAETSLTALYGVLQKTGGKKTQKFSGGFGFGGLGSAVTLTSTIYLARRLGRFVGDIAQSGADYAETLNLWEVSMGKNIDKATKFVNKLNEAYGVSKETLMNSQAIFKNMLGTLGDISDEQAYIISEGVTQMALDYASLYNVTFDQAMTKFQAALAGQVRPIRSVSGYDITETTIYPLYKSLGGEKTQRQLTITEKRLLAILAIFEQMEGSGATGDLKNTMTSFSNQSRVMAESWAQLKSYVGSVLTAIISKSEIIVNISAAMIALSRVFEAIGNTIGAFVSYGDAFSSTGDSAEDASTEVDKLNNSLKQTQNLLSIDKFRSLNQDGNEEEDAPIDKVIEKKFGVYESILEGVNLKAKEVADQILQTFGLLNDDGTINTEKLDEVKDKFDKIVSAIGGIVVAITVLATSSMIKKAADGLATIFSNKYLAIATAIVAVLGYMYTTNEDVRESFNNLAQSLIPVGEILFDVLSNLLVPIADILTALSPIIRFLVGIVEWASIGVMTILIPIVFVLELIITLLKSIIDLFSGEKFSTAWKKMFSSEGLSAKQLKSTISSAERFGTETLLPAVGITGYKSTGKSSTNLYTVPNYYANQTQNYANETYSSAKQENVYKLYLDGEEIYTNVTSHASRRGYKWATQE